MLSALLLLLVLGLATSMIAVGVCLGLIVRAVAERSRLHPDIETGAPLDWAWSPTAPARLHRRLQAALAPIAQRATHRHRAPHDAHAELVGVIVQQATSVDREIILASRTSGSLRRTRLRVLRREVRQIEMLSLRVQEQRAAAATGVSGASRQEVLDDVASRLDLLADAHAELAALEQATTSSDPDEVLRRIAPPPPAVPTQRPHPPRTVQHPHR